MGAISGGIIFIDIISLHFELQFANFSHLSNQTIQLCNTIHLFSCLFVSLLNYSLVCYHLFTFLFIYLFICVSIYLSID